MTWDIQKPNMEATTKVTTIAKKDAQPAPAQVAEREQEAHVQG